MSGCAGAFSRSPRPSRSAVAASTPPPRSRPCSRRCAPRSAPGSGSPSEAGPGRLLFMAEDDDFDVEEGDETEIAVPAPRENAGLSGHEAAEQELLRAFVSGRLP